MTLVHRSPNDSGSRWNSPHRTRHSWRPSIRPNGLRKVHQLTNCNGYTRHTIQSSHQCQVPHFVRIFLQVSGWTRSSKTHKVIPYVVDGIRGRLLLLFDDIFDDKMSRHRVPEKSLKRRSTRTSLPRQHQHQTTRYVCSITQPNLLTNAMPNLLTNAMPRGLIHENPTSHITCWCFQIEHLGFTAPIGPKDHIQKITFRCYQIERLGFMASIRRKGPQLCRHTATKDK